MMEESTYSKKEDEMATITIENLKLRTIIGIFDWERENKQDVIINIKLDFDAQKATQSDDINDTIDYKTLTKAVIEKVEESSYFLVEKLAKEILNICMNNPLVQKASVKVDKPFALRFAESVSLELSDERTQ